LTHGRLSDSMWSMSRKPRRCPGGLAYHVMNRATARETIFAGDGDYAAFERVLAEAREREAGRIRVCAYALMPNHFHLVLWPQSGEDEAVSGLMKWLTLTHAQRWHAHRHTAGTGALYGSRFKSFPVREDWHFLKVCRYVERNPLRANLVERAELWPWCSLNKRLAARHAAEPPAETPEEPVPPGAAELLDEWPVSEPPDWLDRVNAADTAGELEALRRCVRRGRPYGDEEWVMRTADRLGLSSSLRPPGRPRKKAKPSD
jgi:putative transposase